MIISATKIIAAAFPESQCHQREMKVEAALLAASCGDLRSAFPEMLRMFR
jgi:hypothetical protein